MAFPLLLVVGASLLARQGASEATPPRQRIRREEVGPGSLPTGLDGGGPRLHHMAALEVNRLGHTMLSDPVAAEINVHEPAKDDPTMASPSVPTGLADGCQHVFLDVGANRGIHTRALFEPAQYPGMNEYWRRAAEHSPFFSTYKALSDKGGRLPPSSESNVCAFAFEANPKLAPRLQAVEEAYGKMGWRAKFFAPAAVSDRAGKLTFWREPNDGAQLGGQLQKESPYPGAMVNDTVDGIDLGKFLLDHIVHRHLPNQSAPSSVVMKMDIEGSEFTVLPHLLQHGLLCQGGGIDAFTLEWHGDGAPVGPGPKAAELKRQIQTQQGSAKACATQPSQVLDIDDEIAFTDGVPLPNLTAS